MTDFEKYIRQGEPDSRQRAENWQIAIGLQAVDGLKTSAYLIETAQQNIEGEIDINAVKQRINDYYKTEEGRKLAADGTDEADKVAANIADLLAETTFSFIPAEYSRIHRRLFTGVLKHAGEYRTYNISKKEWVLDGDSVIYAPYELLEETLEFDFNRERSYSPNGHTPQEIVEHICRFISGIWQIHPFGEGNTRTTAVFTIKYLQTLGFNTSNEEFKKHSWYFRNALVRANYNDSRRGITATTIFLEHFFENLLFEANHELRNRFCHIYWKGTEQVPNKYRTSTEQVQTGLLPNPKYVEQLVNAIGEKEVSIKEMLEYLQLKHRPNFLDLYLNPAIEQGLVTMLYPDNPHHPRQKYKLTVKGLMILNEKK